MSSLTKLALKRPVSALLIVLALFVFGISSVFGFKMELTPDLEMPMLFVMTIFQGGDPATTEELVTKVIEDSGKTLSGVDSVTSQTTENMSLVMFSYEYGTDTDDAYADLRSAIDTASLQLPDDAQDPVIIEMDMNAQDMMTLSVTSTGDTDVLTFVEDELQPELERLSDVAQITISGGEQDYIRIQLHSDKMQQYGVTMANIRTYITTTDFTIPIGSVEQGSQSVNASASSKPENLMDLQNVPIITARGTTIALSDIATVSMSARANSSISRYNGQDSISIGIAKVQRITQELYCRYQFIHVWEITFDEIHELGQLAVLLFVCAFHFLYLFGLPFFTFLGFIFKFRNAVLQGCIFPFQCLDLVTSEKRTYTFGYISGCCRGCTFQFLGLHLFLGPPEFFLYRFLAVLKLFYVCL